jgi:hypothetical protein
MVCIGKRNHRYLAFDLFSKPPFSRPHHLV